jgi:dihydroorotate dehydrogenase (fumarate)
LGEPLRGRVAPARVGLSAPSRLHFVRRGSATIPLAFGCFAADNIFFHLQNNAIMPIDISTDIAGISLESCIFNASGPWCSTLEELEAIGASASAAILSKSCTLEAREGNAAPRYVDTTWGSINAMGLPNKGWRYYRDIASELQAYAKPYFISVAGMTHEHNLFILEELQDCPEVSAIELNLSCPNLAGKPQTAYDMAQTRQLLDAVFNFNHRVLGVKLPPYFDPVHFEQAAEVLNDYPLAFVTCINSIGNGLAVDADSETTLIRPKNGLGGLGGSIVKPTALANVREFRRLLRPNIAVIGCGGISTGRDAFEHILCGAQAVQIGTQFHQECTNCFARIADELSQIMQSKGYTKLSDFRNKLRTV